METWKAIPGYEGLYEASLSGQIRTAPGKVTSNRRFKERRWKTRIMKGRGDRYTTGRRVNLWKDGKPKEYLVARLVAATFLGPPPEGYTVNHKDGNRLNNCVDNLEWLTTGDNTRHAFDTGLNSAAFAVVLRNEYGERVFRSMAQASEALGRNKGYLNNCAKHGRKVLDTSGREYEVVRVKGGRP